MPAGAPTTYTEEFAEKVCQEIANSTLSLAKLCEQVDWMPSDSTIYLWVSKHPEFSDRFKKAKAASYYKALDEAPKELEDRLHYYYDDKGNRRIDSPSSTLSMAALNTKKWLLQKFAPNEFGDKPAQNEQSSQNSVLEKILNGEITIKKND